MAEQGIGSATSMTLAAVAIGLAVTEEMTAADQNAVANLLFAAAQAISTRASFLPESSSSSQTFHQATQTDNP